MQNHNIIPINSNRRSGDGYRLPFGKHRGHRLSTVPTPYLRWLVSQAWLSEYSRFELMDELGRRGELFDEMVLQIIGLKAEIDRLRKQLEEGERRHYDAVPEGGSANEGFLRAIDG
jgi:uncharacterized protein (DUF3820 family)